MSLGEMTRDEIAARLEMSPAQISRWMGDKGAPPKRIFIRAWALATDVDPDWLETGEGGPSGGPSDGDARAQPTVEQVDSGPLQLFVA